MTFSTGSLCPHECYTLSGQSIYKSFYDRYASSYFQSHAWDSYIVNKGGLLCDVVAVKDNEVAIVEVKSSAEGSCGQDYNDIKGMSSTQLISLPSHFSHWRRLIFNGINNVTGLSLTKLFAISIACQLFRYLHEHNEKYPKYMRAIGDYLPHSQLYHLIPFFVAPIEARQQVNYALSYLKENGYIFDFSTKNTCKLYVAEIAYNRSYIGFRL